MFGFFLPALEVRAESESSPNPSQSKDYELMAGTLIPAKNGLDQTIPGWGARLSLPTAKGVFEPSFFCGKGNAITYNTASFDYRLDIPVDPLFIHFLIGLHADQYGQGPPDSRSALFTGGWEFGGGAMIQLVDRFFMRFDFRDRFSPGNVLEVTVGLSYRIPSEASGGG